MTDSASLHTPSPLELDRVQSSRPHAGEIRLRLSGRWIDANRTAGEEEELLVVSVEGRRHRFPARRDERNGEELAAGRWSATFTVPAWAEPRREGQAALWLGDAVVPVPPMRQQVVVEAPRSGPLAELLLKEKVAAEQSEAPPSDRAVESTLDELRSELERLRVAVQDQRREIEAQRREIGDQHREIEDQRRAVENVRQQLATAEVAREAAVSEAAGLRSELERVGSELAVTRERAETEAGELGEARRLLADARALAEELRTTGTDGWDTEAE
jgi:hypothetical protein